MGRGANQKPADLSPIQPRLWRRRRSHRWRRDYEHALLAIQHTTIRHLSRAWPLVDAGCPQLRESTIAVTFAVTAIFFAQPAKSSLSASMLRRRLSSTRSALYRISNMLAAMRYQRDELAKTEKTPLIAAFHAACISLTNVWHMHCQMYGIVPTTPQRKGNPHVFVSHAHSGWLRPDKFDRTERSPARAGPQCFLDPPRQRHQAGQFGSRPSELRNPIAAPITADI